MADKKVVLNGNTYHVRDGVVTKDHGKGEKVVNDPKRKAEVLAMAKEGLSEPKPNLKSVE